MGQCWSGVIFWSKSVSVLEFKSIRTCLSEVSNVQVHIWKSIVTSPVHLNSFLFLWPLWSLLLWKLIQSRNPEVSSETLIENIRAACSELFSQLTWSPNPKMSPMSSTHVQSKLLKNSSTRSICEWLFWELMSQWPILSLFQSRGPQLNLPVVLYNNQHLFQAQTHEVIVLNRVKHLHRFSSQIRVDQINHFAI